MIQRRDCRVQIVIIENGQYIVLKHVNKEKNDFFYGLPGGGVEPGETLEEAAIREAKEETGLDIKLLPFKHIVKIKDNPVYNRKATFIGIPFNGEAKLGYDPEDESLLLYTMTEMKWDKLNETEHLNDYMREDIEAVNDYLAQNDFIKRAGALIYKLDGGKPLFLLATSNKNKSIFIIPQGHVEEGENFEQAAMRESIEEAGADIELKKEIGFFIYERENRFYQTFIYLAKYIVDGIQKDDRETKWVSYEDIKTLNLLKETRRFFEELNLKELS